jgi:RHS repeat-associated protein
MARSKFTRLFALACSGVAILAAGCGGASSDGPHGKLAQPSCAIDPNPCLYGVDQGGGQCVYMPVWATWWSCWPHMQVDTSTTASFPDQYRFLWDAATSVQTGLTNPIVDAQVAVIEGKVLGDGQWLSGTPVTIVAPTGYGSVKTEYLTGRFFAAVNAGAPLRLRFSQPGFVSAERVVQPVAGQVTVMDNVELVRVPTSTPVTQGNGSWQMVSGAAQTDSSGTRTARVFFPPNTTWTPSGTANVALAEFTAGTNGEQRMPATLPPNSAFTFALELHATDAGGAEIHPTFTPPTGQSVVVYVDNFLGLPVGLVGLGGGPNTVPTGYYDYDKGAWVQHSDGAGPANGMVVKIVAISGGAVQLDTDGDGAIDNNGVPLGERQKLATLPSYYPVGSQFWRVPVAHFSPYDFNWSFGLPAGAVGAVFAVEAGGTDGPCTTSGSIIECENGVLGEEIPVTGTPYKLAYRSNRVPGYSAARQARVTVPAASAQNNFKGIPSSAKQIIFKATVAGNEYTETRNKPGSAWVDEVFAYTWSGNDLFGRKLNGAQPITFKVGLVYDGNYGPTAQFGLPPSASSYFANLTRKQITLWTTWAGTIGALDAKSLGFDGWTLDVQHFYAAGSQTLYFGYGAQERASSLSQTVAPVPTNTGQPCGDPRKGPICGSAQYCDGAVCQPMSYVRGITFGPDGALYVANSHNATIGSGQSGQVLKVLSDGSAAVLPFGTLNDPTSVAVGADGSVYVTESGQNQVKKLAPDLSVSIVAGHLDGTAGNAVEGCVESVGNGCGLSHPAGLAAGLDGSLYVADYTNQKIRRLSPDGTLTTVVNVLGSTHSGTGGDDGLAKDAPLGSPIGLALDATGNLYVADHTLNRIRRVDPAGIIHTYAGKTSGDPNSDGIWATDAALQHPNHLVMAPDGSLYFADSTANRFRKITPEGRIVTIAGPGAPGTPACTGDGGPARSATFSAPDGVAWGPDNVLYVSSDLCNDSGKSPPIRKITSPMPGVSIGGALLPSPDGTELYAFDEIGRHLYTVDALTFNYRYYFWYTTYGTTKLLTGVSDLRGASDGIGQFTSINRDANGALLGIHQNSSSQGVDITPDASGWLSDVYSPGDDDWEWTVAHDSATGLLANFWSDGSFFWHGFSYDSDGRLTDDRDSQTQSPDPAFRHLSRTDDGTTATVAVTSAQGLTTTYTDTQLFDGGHSRSMSRPDYSVQSTLGIGGERTVNLPDGSTLTSTTLPDPRFGLSAPTSEQTLTLTPNKSLIVRVTRETPLGVSNPLAFTTFTEKRTIKKNSADSGLVYQRKLDRTSPPGFVLLTSPAGRRLKATLDSYGRVDSIAPDYTPSEVYPVTFEYDGNGSGPGKLTRIKQGNRSVKFDYDPSTRFLSAVHRGTLSTDYLNTNYFISPDGSLWKRTTATTDVRTSSGPTGFLYSLKPQGTSIVHTFFAETWGPAPRIYNPPDVPGVPSDNTFYYHDTDRRPTSTTWPNGSTLAAAYYSTGAPQGSLGKLHTLTGSGPASTATFSYDSVSRLSSIVTSPGGITTGFDYTGDDLHGWGKLLRARSTTWPGPTTSEVVDGYDDYLRLSSESPTGGLTASYLYDSDSLVTDVSGTGFDLNTSDRSSQSGRLKTASIGSLSTSYQYDGGSMTYGNLTQIQTTFSATNKYKLGLSYDDGTYGLGRISTRTDQVGTNPQTSVDYTYDSESRLASTSSPSHTYAYDLRGNLTTLDGHVRAIYDLQDRINCFATSGDLTTCTGAPIGYGYDYAGRRATRTEGSQTTTYGYDASGNLASVVLPSGGGTISYTLDGLGRRVSRVLGGVETRYLYAEGNRIVAVLNSSGSIATQFVYATNRHVPDLMISFPSQTVYRLLTDHLGSVRLVVKVSDGSIAQQVDYDVWGNATLVTGTWGFQPLGFAGGLYDSNAKLVHFGAREYDPQIGRWLTKDPILFGGGTNLYVYANDDPTNRIDPDGLWGFFGWGSDTKGWPTFIRPEAESIGLGGWDSDIGFYSGGIGATGMAAGTEGTYVAGYHGAEVLSDGTSDWIDLGEISVDPLGESGGPLAGSGVVIGVWHTEGAGDNGFYVGGHSGFFGKSTGAGLGFELPSTWSRAINHALRIGPCP